MDAVENRTSFWNSAAAKIIHLILFGILLPCLCIVIPVYAKFILYADSVVTFGASDMRIVDGHVSTIWCQVQITKLSPPQSIRLIDCRLFDYKQSQNVQMNTSFDAFLMPEKPEVSPKPQKLSMTRHFGLDDDLKEYWGFYLLKGSEVTVSSCAK